jgi:tRNA(adenine34) deaminase
MKNDQYFMQIALKEAKKAQSSGEVPVGCIIVGVNGKILSRGYNLTEKRFDPAAHAELIAIRKLSKRIKSWRLDGTVLYTTLQPCLMCMGAIINSRIGRLVYGADDPRSDVAKNLYKLKDLYTADNKLEIRKNILRDDCSLILRSFFKTIRTKQST